MFEELPAIVEISAIEDEPFGILVGKLATEIEKSLAPFTDPNSDVCKSDWEKEEDSLVNLVKYLHQGYGSFMDESASGEVPEKLKDRMGENLEDAAKTIDVLLQWFYEADEDPQAMQDFFMQFYSKGTRFNDR